MRASPTNRLNGRSEMAARIQRHDSDDRAYAERRWRDAVAVRGLQRRMPALRPQEQLALLSRLEDRHRVTFDELIHAELEAADGVRLRSSTVTNAIKYGALSQRPGRLVVVWRRKAAGADDPPRLHIDWRESGPAPAPFPADVPEIDRA